MLKTSTQFKKDLKRIKKQGKDTNTIRTVIEILIHKKILEKKYKNHKLIGNWLGYSECHIESDLILIYRIDSKKGLLQLARIGSHSHLFKF